MHHIRHNYHPRVILLLTRHPHAHPALPIREIFMIHAHVDVSAIADEALLPCHLLAHIVDIPLRRVVVGPEGEFIEEAGVRVACIVVLEGVGCGREVGVEEGEEEEEDGW